MDCIDCKNFKPSNGINIHIPYKVGDTFWEMHSNLPTEVTITEIKICIGSNDNFIVQFICTYFRNTIVTLCKTIEDIKYKTKQELIESL